MTKDERARRKAQRAADAEHVRLYVRESTTDRPIPVADRVLFPKRIKMLIRNPRRTVVSFKAKGKRVTFLSKNPTGASMRARAEWDLRREIAAAQAAEDEARKTDAIRNERRRREIALDAKNPSTSKKARSAQNAVAYAVRMGRLRPPRRNLVAHHPDYRRKLDVEWMTLAQHAKLHTKKRAS